MVRTLGIAMIFLTGCSRTLEDQGSKIRIVVPDSVSSKTLGAQSVDTSSMCFAVNVYGPGIDNGPNQCGVRAGVSSALVKPGAEISVEVSRGSNRTVQLLRYELASPADSCPELNLFECPNDQAVLCSVFPAGETRDINVNEDEQVVDVVLDVTSSTSVSTTGPCASGEVQATLLLAGNVVKNGSSQPQSNPTNVAISMNSGIIETWDVAGRSSSGLNVPLFVRSMTRKPDSTKLYGVISAAGDFDQVVELDGLGNYSLPSSCPFDSCSVPKWIHSISAGYGTNLFGVDSSGGLYKLTSGVPVRVKTLSPNVAQVVAY